uniref:BTB domain-containing protein n=1 Tax=Oryza punctata TaxID=4537 RepID=A0A0E0MHF4_ORYPU
MPPPVLGRHLGELLFDDETADVRFGVRGETFPAQRCVLAAQSPVFRAELLGSMKEHAARTIRVDDMKVPVFAALFYFIYTDELSEIYDERVATMAAHLLVAADRLKKSCEDKIVRHLDVGTAATSLALAELHGCPRLKEVILWFLVASPEKSKTIMASEEYQHVITDFPSIATEIVLAMLSANSTKQAN